jgi:anti-sigma regulatory factor (Ser/Thr protein kinase)
VTPPAPLREVEAEARTAETTSVSRPLDAAVPHFRFELAAHPGSAAQARRMTRAWLAAWAICEDTCDSAALVISELVTNAIVHTSSRQIVCELTDEAEKVRIAVCDEGRISDEPSASARRDEEDHGRGLLLVAAMCSAWGAQEAGRGLQVWAELPLGATDRRGAPAEPVRGTGSEWGP